MAKQRDRASVPSHWADKRWHHLNAPPYLGDLRETIDLRSGRLFGGKDQRIVNFSRLRVCNVLNTSWGAGKLLSVLKRIFINKRNDQWWNHRLCKINLYAFFAEFYPLRSFSDKGKSVKILEKSWNLTFWKISGKNHGTLQNLFEFSRKILNITIINQNKQ